jgi:hypothetical protein
MTDMERTLFQSHLVRHKSNMEVKTGLCCENPQSELWRDRLGLTDIPTQLHLSEKRKI